MARAETGQAGRELDRKAHEHQVGLGPARAAAPSAAEDLAARLGRRGRDDLEEQLFKVRLVDRDGKVACEVSETG